MIKRTKNRNGMSRNITCWIRFFFSLLERKFEGAKLSVKWNYIVNRRFIISSHYSTLIGFSMKYAVADNHWPKAAWTAFARQIRMYHSYHITILLRAKAMEQKNPKNYSRNIKIDSLRSACVLSLYLTNLPCYASIPWMIVWVILRENGDHERKWNHINEISGAFRYISFSLKLILWLCFSWLFIHLDRFGVKWVCCHYHYMDPNPDEWACVCVLLALNFCDDFNVLLNDAVTKLYRIIAIKFCTPR